MVVVNRKQIDDNPVVVPDEGWWESVLSDEQRFAIAPSGKENSHRLREHPNDQLQPHIPASATLLPGPDGTGPILANAHGDIAPAVSPQGAGQARQAKPPVQAEPAATLTPADWANAMQVYKDDQIVTLTVTNYNRGGLLVESSHLQGFVPYSHLVDMTCQSEQERDRFLSEYVGRDLRLKVIECVPDEGRIVFSERAARADAGRRTQLFSSLKVGDIALGEVTNITDFGVFVDLGGVEGLIHISELSWGRVVHPSNILKLGQKIEVQVLSILLERCRIALSLKRLKPNPWETISQRYAVNDVVPAVITSVVSFGVFARLEEGLEGLVHISEMEPEGLVVKNIFTEGQHIDVRILHIEPQHQRLGLSLKLNGNQTDAFSASLPR
jgi:small subunit ribosomal protein S1